MKLMNVLFTATAVVCTLLSYAQNPSEGIVRYDADGLARSVMNLDIKQFTGTDAEIANQYYVANKTWICGGENGDYEFSNVIENPSGKHFNYIQKIAGIPVMAAGLVISLNNLHHISFVYNGYKKNLNPPLIPVYNATQAISIALNTFDNPAMILSQPASAVLSIYQDINKSGNLVWDIRFSSNENGTWQVLVDAIDSKIIVKQIFEFSFSGTGKVWDPNPASLGIQHIFPDLDYDSQSYNPAYVIRELKGLNEPVNNMYSLKGEYAASFDLASPNDAVTSQPTSDFLFTRYYNGFEETNCYYHIDKMIRYIHSLGFSPTWNNQTTNTNKDLIFDARGTTTDQPSYMLGSGNIKYSVPTMGADAGEDESVIIHEVGHGIHDALLPFGCNMVDPCVSISEGIANYLGIDYRRQVSLILPTYSTIWFQPGDLINNSFNFLNNWIPNDPRTCSAVWASSLFDLEYISAVDPAQGYRLGRDVVTKNQLSALSYLTASSTNVDNVLAMYQADLDTYNGLHLREYIDVYHNRHLFDNQNVYGNITANVNWQGYKKINGSIHVLSGATVNISSNSIVVLDGEFILDQGSILNIGNNVKFIGYNPSHRIILNGTVNTEIGGAITGLTIMFSGTSSASNYFTGLSTMNINQVVTLNNATFTNSRLFNNGAGLIVNNSTFEDCNKNISNRGNITYDNCTLNKTGLYFENQNNDPNTVVTVKNCFMNGQDFFCGLDQTGYKKFLISKNSIQNYAHGIRVFNSGLTSPSNQIINDNDIFNCSAIGLTCYYSYADITMNRIYGNAAGIGLYNASTTKIIGNLNATNVIGTQQIMNNSSYELLISRSSIPAIFKWNFISDPDNSGGQVDPLIYYLPPTGGLVSLPIVTYNCWGANFNASQDLYCTTGCSFTYEPTWCPSGKKSGNTSDDAENLFNTALELVNNGYYNDAKSKFRALVNEYHNTIFAETSLKELFLLESLTSKDYLDLKGYYQTNDTIQISENLIDLADYFANKCNEKLGNYQDCINWYENKILYSQSEDDSIFATIDLGYLYLAIQNSGLKQLYSGNRIQLIPENKIKFEENRDYLLALLPGTNVIDPKRKQLQNLGLGKLLQNNPNPFTSKTEIWYRIEKRSQVAIRITDQTGKQLKMIKLGTINLGLNKFDFASDGLSSGLYFYSLIIDGNLSDTKKMNIIR